MFESLKSFQKKNHHCKKVPREYAEVPTLGVGVSMQRFYSKSMIDRNKQTYMINTKLLVSNGLADTMHGRQCSKVFNRTRLDMEIVTSLGI